MVREKRRRLAVRREVGVDEEEGDNVSGVGRCDGEDEREGTGECGAGAFWASVARPRCAIWGGLKDESRIVMLRSCSETYLGTVSSCCGSC